jgi:hypothetical protein
MTRKQCTLLSVLIRVPADLQEDKISQHRPRDAAIDSDFEIKRIGLVLPITQALEHGRITEDDLSFTVTQESNG